MRTSPVWAVLALGALLSGFAWVIADARIDRAGIAAAEQAMRAARDDIQARLDSAYDVLYGVRGLYLANPRVSRADFHSYISSLQLAERHPGVRTVAYAELIGAQDKAKLVSTVRGDRSVNPEGYPEFDVRPAGERARYLPLLYLEPVMTEALGVDLLVEPRLESVERARDSGRAVVSVPHVLATDPARQPAFTMRVATYRKDMPTSTVDERRAAFQGMVSAAFVVANLVGDVFTGSAVAPMGVRMIDRAPSAEAGTAGSRSADSLLFEKSAPAGVVAGVVAGAHGYFEGQLMLDAGGRSWVFSYTGNARDFVSPADRMLPWILLIAGLLMSGLLAGLVRSLSSARERARRLALRITEDLRASEARLGEAQRLTEAMFEALPNPIYHKGVDGRYRGVNKAWETFFGIPRTHFIGKTVYDLYPNDSPVAQRLDALDQELWQSQGNQTYDAVIPATDGTRHDVVYYKATYQRDDGGVAGLVGTMIDVTERKRIERRQAMEHAVTRVLADAESLDIAIPRIIQTICETMGWHYGDRYEYDRDSGLLMRREVWAIDTPEMREFAEAGAHRSTRPDASGGGLIRRTYATGEVVWMSDVSQNLSLERQALIQKAGLRGACAFPLVAGGVTLGVMEFFHRDAREPDQMLIAIGESIGSQIGQYIVRTQAEAAVRHVAMHDALTDLPNRVMFNHRLEQAVAQAQRHGRMLAVMFVDLDRFKIINDTLGHEAGDHLLREVAQRLTGELRLSDIVARLGGDEFVVLLDDVADVDAVGVVADKIVNSLTSAFRIADQDVHVSASVGIAAYPADAQDMRTLMKYADIAMYRAKEQGRNNFQFYSDQISVHSFERLTLEAQLRRALERDEFVLHYQPIVEAKTGAVVGMEALVRWQQTGGDLVEPAKFIPIAEETGLIVPIGLWVLQKACEQHRKWAELGMARVRVSVNLSPRQFVHRTLVEDIVSALESAGVGGECLELEITETTVMQNAPRTIELLGQLKAKGIRIAVDDFGTGYSSLAYLKRFPIDSLKIDRSFISELPGNASDAAIAQAIVSMAHNLDLTVIAEGVETAEQIQFLREHGCDELQGYYFNKPMPGPEATALLLNSGVAGGSNITPFDLGRRRS